MRTASALAACLCAVLQTRAAIALGDTDERRAVDPAKTKAQFSIQHVFVEHVTGTLPVIEGWVTLAAGSTVPSSATAVLDATKIDTGDTDRDGSLTSPDFFDAKKFPTWTFTSTKITAQGPAAFGMDGMLTVHGVTQPEHLDVTVGGNAAHPSYHAVGHIDRRAFGMTVTRLDPSIGGIADVTLDIALK